VDCFIRRVAICHSNFTSKHIDKALNDIDWMVRRDAISHPNATTDHITKALNDDHEYVREAAQAKIKEAYKTPNNNQTSVS